MRQERLPVGDARSVNEHVIGGAERPQTQNEIVFVPSAGLMLFTDGALCKTQDRLLVHRPRVYVPQV